MNIELKLDDDSINKIKELLGCINSLKGKFDIYSAYIEKLLHSK